jgi:hypothetical protein
VAAKTIFKVAVGEVSGSPCRLVLVAPRTMTRERPPLYHLAKTMPAACNRRQDGMQGDQGGGGTKAGPIGALPVMARLTMEPTHDAQHHVERRGLVHEASLALANQITAA